MVGEYLDKLNCLGPEEGIECARNHYRATVSVAVLAAFHTIVCCSACDGDSNNIERLLAKIHHEWLNCKAI
jgi:hypothetical protein